MWRFCAWFVGVTVRAGVSIGSRPHVFLAPGATATIDLTTLFAGYTNSPIFSAESNTTAVSATIGGSILTVKAGGTRSLGTVTLSVRDADDATYERRLCVAVTDHATTAIHEVSDKMEEESSEVFDLQGRRITKAVLPGIYIQNGHKIIIR